MDVYEVDSDRFSREYLAYLATLTSTVGDLSTGGTYRITRDATGTVVRIETWTPPRDGDGAYGYVDMPQAKWMKPDYPLE